MSLTHSAPVPRTCSAKQFDLPILHPAPHPSYAIAIMPPRALPSPPIPQIRRLISKQIRVAIGKAVASAPIALLMKGTPEISGWRFSLGVIKSLSNQGVNSEKFAALKVLENEELRSGIREHSEWPIIPKLYIENEFIGGADIVQQMFKSGELGSILSNKELLVPVPKT